MAIVLQGTISALGYFESGVYYPEPDCFESLRDIIRFLRNDDKQFSARCQCGEKNIVENDLVPLMCTPNLSNELFDISLRLCANLLQPTIVTFQGKAPEDKEQVELYVKLQNYLSRSKAAFANFELFKVLRVKMEKYFMDTPLEERDEDDRLLMERILLLLRFVFSIGQTFNNNEHLRRSQDVHDLVLKAFLDSEIDTVLLFIGASKVDRDFHLSVLEIISMTLKEYDPKAILEAKNGRDEETKRKEEMELRQAFEEEERKRILQQQNVVSSRHSRFGGSYVIKGRSSINPEKDMLAMKVVKDASQTNYLDNRKKKKMMPKNRRVAEEKTLIRAPPTSLALKLNVYVARILDTCYNNLTKSSKDMAFNGGTRALAHRNADVQFFIFLQFCLQYARFAKIPSEKVDQMLGKEAFHFVQMAKVEKQKAKQHGARAQYALSSYKELILYHQHLIDHGTQVEKEFGLETCDHILRMQEYRDLGIQIFKQFTPGVLTKGFLRELILATHYYLKILEQSAKSNSLKIVKRQKKKKQRKAKQDQEGKMAKATEKKNKLLDKMTENQLEELWDVLRSQIEETITENEVNTEDLLPINSALQVDDDEHKRFLLLRIQRALRNSDMKLAIGLNKAGRELFPSDEAFGKDGQLEEELAHLKELFFVDLREVAVSLHEAESKLEGYLNENANNEEYNEYLSEEGSEPEFDEVEENFEFNSHLVQFARPDILKWYIFILNDFLVNSNELNKAILKMIHRIAFDLKDPSRLFQVSFFQTLLNVKNHLISIEKEKQKESPYYEIYKFGHHFLNSFFNFSQKLGSQLFLECLFWKTPKECYEIEHGFGSYFQEKNTGPATWTDELEVEVRDLHREFADMDERPAGMDMLDFIEHNLSRPRNRKQIHKKLKELGLDALGAKVNKETFSGFPLIAARDAYLGWQKLDEDNKPDLVDYIQKNLLEDHGEFSRPKIIKQLAYIGANYEGKVRVKPWNEGLLSELRSLKEQYEESTEEERMGSTLLGYTLKRLSEKKPRKQVIQQLAILGADLTDEMQKETERKEPKKKRAKRSESSDEEEPAIRSESEPETSEHENSTDSDGGRDKEEPRAKKKTKKTKTKNRFNVSDDEDGVTNFADQPNPSQSANSDEQTTNSSQPTRESDGRIKPTTPKITKKRYHFVDSEDDEPVDVNSQTNEDPDEENRASSQLDSESERVKVTTPKTSKGRTLMNDSDDDGSLSSSSEQVDSQAVLSGNKNKNITDGFQLQIEAREKEMPKVAKKRYRVGDEEETADSLDRPTSNGSSTSDSETKQTRHEAPTKKRRVVLSDDSDSD